MVDKKDITEEQKLEIDRQFDILSSGVVEIVPEGGLLQKLTHSVVNQTPLNIKLGLDPTAPDIHVGHTVVIQKLRQFQDLGHQIQLILGDFTAKIGDPTGKSETRKQLSNEDVKRNAQTYVQQYSKILDMTKTRIYYNSEWLAPLQFADVVELSAKSTVARMLERDDFEKRYKSNQAISIHEFFYPLMQGYDSIALESDVELGGTDQKFNLLMGRHLQKEYGQAQQIAITMPLLEGLDGVQKMSKSLGNYIGIDEEPNQIYGKAMSIPDSLMLKYFELATPMSVKECGRLAQQIENEHVHPRDAKMRLAHTFVVLYHGENAANKAQEHFQTVFQKGNLPDDMPQKEWFGEVQVSIVDFITGLELVSSKGEGRRMVQQGAVKIDGQKVEKIEYQVHVQKKMIVQVGKRKFCKIV